jgi:hypothetical protein
MFGTAICKAREGWNRVQESTKRWVALLLLAGLAVVAWKTLDAGRMRDVVWILLGGFALRVLLARGHSRYDGEKEG